jgi:DNA-binding CsgD family transcriptional regulator
MDQPEQLSQLIGDIYDASLDRGLWPTVLEKTCEYVQGACAALVAQDPFANSGQFYFSWGVDPEYERLYLEKYIKLNPAIFATMATSSAGAVESTATVMPYDEFTASRFYREWARPQGYCDSVWTILEKSTTAAAALSVLRHERHGLADEEARGHLRLLAPHFRRAVAIGKLIDLHKVEGAALADTLDGIAAAMFLVDADARIVHANISGRVLVSAGTVARNADGRLSVTDPQADQALRLVFSTVSSGDIALEAKGIAVPLTEPNGDYWVAHVLPLTSGARRNAGTCYSAVAAVFVRKAAIDLPSPLETIANSYKLTPAELRVLMAIIQIGGVPEVAPVLGISETTVKTHLQRVFEKTGTNRQADLIKLVAGYMNPLGR